MVQIGPVVVGSTCGLHKVAPSINLNPVGHVAGILRSLIEDGEYFSPMRQEPSGVGVYANERGNKAQQRFLYQCLELVVVGS